MMDEKTKTAVMLLAASFCGGALASLLLGGPVGAQGPQAVTTTQVNLVDAGGSLRGILSAADERGQPSLAFHDADGRVRGRFGVERSGAPAIDLWNAAGERRLSVRVAGDDALLVVGGDEPAQGSRDDGDGARRVVFGSAAGTPVLDFAAGRRSRMQLQLGEGGAPSLVLFGRDGSRRAAVTVGGDDTPLMTLYDAGRPRVTLGVVRQAAVLNLSGAAESRLVVGVAGNGRPSVTFVDAAGQVVGELP